MRRPCPDFQFHIAHAYRAPALEAMAGGDFFAYHRYGDGTICAILGDVSAKRVEGLSLAHFLMKAFQHVASRYSQPSNILRELNSLLLSAVGDDRRGECFATALVCRFRADTGSLEYATAGMEGPLIAEQSRSFRQGPCGGMLLGIDQYPQYDDIGVPFTKGCTLVGFTDGVFESRHTYRPRAQIGLEVVVEAAETSLHQHGRASVHQIFAELESHNGGLYRDDATLFVVSALP